MKKFFVVCMLVLATMVGTSMAALGSVKIPEALAASNFTVGGGYSYLYFDNSFGSTHVPKGWWAEGAYKFDLAGIGEKDFSVFAEISGHYKNKTTYTQYLGGLRYYMPELFKGVIPYVHGMLGFGNYNYDHANKFLYGAGVGALVPINKHLSIKAVQFDVLHQTGYNATVLRLSTGAVVNF
jgi:hypothetical protein